MHLGIILNIKTFKSCENPLTLKDFLVNIENFQNKQSLN